MKREEGLPLRNRQLAMFLPITGGRKDVPASLTPDQEETFRELMLSQLEKAGLRSRSAGSDGGG